MRNQVVVIGGGVIGLACALRSSQAGQEVLLLDAGGPASPASFGNAGHIAIEQTRPLAAPESVRSAPGRLFALGGALDFRLRDIGAWGRWVPSYLAASTSNQAQAGEQALGGLLALAMPAWRKLAADLGAPGLLIEDGHLIAWEATASAKAGLARWSGVDTGQAVVQPMTRSEVYDLSSLTKVRLAGAARITNTAQISDPTLMMLALDRSFRALGGERRAVRVTGLGRAEQGVDILLADGERLHCGRVVIAAGVGSGPLLGGLGYAAPVIAERGYHVEGALSEGGAYWRSLPPVVFEDRSMIVTRFGDRLRASSFVEFGREDSAPDKRKWARLKRHCAELGLPMRGPLREWMGARPTLPDYLPAIGTGEGGLVYAFGHQHLGLTLAALTSELVADLVTGRKSAIDLGPFNLGRFAKRKLLDMERR